MELTVSEPRVIETIPLGQHQFVKHAVISPDTTMCALHIKRFYSEDNKLEVYSLEPFEKINEFSLEKNASAVRFSSNSRKLFAVAHNKFHVYDLESGELKKVIKSGEEYDMYKFNQIFTDSLWSIQDSSGDEKDRRKPFILQIFKNSSKRCRLLCFQRAARQFHHVSSDGKNFSFFSTKRTFKVVNLTSGTTIKRINFFKEPAIKTIALTNELSILLKWKELVVKKHTSHRCRWTTDRKRGGLFEFTLSADEQQLLLKDDRYISIFDLQSFPPQKVGSVDAIEVLNTRHSNLLACHNNIVIGNSRIGDEHDDNECQSAVTIFDISPVISKEMPG